MKQLLHKLVFTSRNLIRVLRFLLRFLHPRESRQLRQAEGSGTIGGHPSRGQTTKNTDHKRNQPQLPTITITNQLPAATSNNHTHDNHAHNNHKHHNQQPKLQPQTKPTTATTTKLCTAISPAGIARRGCKPQPVGKSPLTGLQAPTT